MITVKLTYPKSGAPLQEQNVPLRQTTDDKGLWGDYQFVVDKELDECDYWVVYDEVGEPETCRCPKENTILVTGEAPHIGVYPTVFLRQFGHIITCHQDINGQNVMHNQQALPWFVNKTYRELIEMQPVEKTKDISLITSKRHPWRYQFALKLKKEFGDQIDLFGAGINPVEDKWDALAPYRHSIVMENGMYPDYFTEKLSDCYLAFTYPLYYGCSNLRHYFSPRSFTTFDVNDWDMAVQTIESALKLWGMYDHVLPSLIESRYAVLNQYNLFPMIVRYIQTNQEKFGKVKQEITLRDKGRFVRDKTMFLKKLWRGE